MLRIVIQNGESIRIGEDIVVKSMTDNRVSLAIDAPKQYKIERIFSEGDSQLKPKERN